MIMNSILMKYFVYEIIEKKHCKHIFKATSDTFYISIQKNETLTTWISLKGIKEPVTVI